MIIKIVAKNHFMDTTIQKVKGHTSDNFVLDNYIFAHHEILSLNIGRIDSFVLQMKTMSSTG